MLDVGDDLLDGVAGNGKRAAAVVTRLGVDHRVDADEFTGGVHQGTSRVAGVNGCIMLDEGLDAAIVAGVHATCLGADDAGSNGRVETEGVAHGDAPLAGLDGVTVAKGDCVQILGIDLDQGDVGLLVGTHHGGVKLAVVIQGDLQFLGAVDHVVVGDDVTVSADDNTRAHARGLRFALLLRLLLALTLTLSKAGAEEELKRVNETSLVIVLLRGGIALDAHHAVDGVLGHIGEITAQIHCPGCCLDKAVA